MRVFALVALAAVSLAAIASDRVTYLPGWSAALPSTHYSGYIQIPGNKYLHYWLIQSERDPTNDPLVLWMNGGPGSSSLIGLLTENGQFFTADASLVNETSGVPNLFYNEYGWTRVANVLWVEHPAGVGFSYCTDSNNKTITCSNTDDSMATDFYQFLLNWFKAYPEFSKNDFYITGESYAGVYIPLIAQQVMNNANTINLKGLAIGNGCIGNTVGSCAGGDFTPGDPMRIAVNFYYGHALLSQQLYAQIIAACGDFSKPSVACEQKITLMEGEIGNFDVYNIYDECGNDEVSLPKLSDYFVQDAPGKPYYYKAFANKIESTGFRRSGLLGEAINDYPCGAENAMDVYLAQPSVQAALHVKSGGKQIYTKTATDLRPLYHQLVQKYRVLIYSGDADACVPYYGSEEWTYALGYNVTATWKPWIAKFQTGHQGTAGYVTSFSNNFSFLTIKGAGHMVPEFQPGAAFDMISRFLANQPF